MMALVTDKLQVLNLSALNFFSHFAPLACVEELQNLCQ